jgi:hypothetical protein
MQPHGQGTMRYLEPIQALKSGFWEDGNLVTQPSGSSNIPRGSVNISQSNKENYDEETADLETLKLSSGQTWTGKKGSDGNGMGKMVFSDGSVAEGEFTDFVICNGTMKGSGTTAQGKFDSYGRFEEGVFSRHRENLRRKD